MGKKPQKQTSPTAEPEHECEWREFEESEVCRLAKGVFQREFKIVVHCTSTNPNLDLMTLCLQVCADFAKQLPKIEELGKCERPAKSSIVEENLLRFYEHFPRPNARQALASLHTCEHEIPIVIPQCFAERNTDNVKDTYKPIHIGGPNFTLGVDTNIRLATEMQTLLEYGVVHNAANDYGLPWVYVRRGDDPALRASCISDYSQSNVTDVVNVLRIYAEKRHEYLTKRHNFLHPASPVVVEVATEKEQVKRKQTNAREPNAAMPKLQNSKERMEYRSNHFGAQYCALTSVAFSSDPRSRSALQNSQVRKWLTFDNVSGAYESMLRAVELHECKDYIKRDAQGIIISYNRSDAAWWFIKAGWAGNHTYMRKNLPKAK